MNKENMIKVIKIYEKKHGYSVCNICNNLIESGQRIVINREEINPYRLYKIGAVCFKCYEKLLKRNYGFKK